MEENSSAGAPVLRGSPRPEGQSFAGKQAVPSIAEVLAGAANLIESGGLAKGNFIDGLCYCVRGAICQAAGINVHAPDKTGAEAFLAQHLGDAPGNGSRHGSFLVRWNDAPERTKDDVVRALREAAAKAEGRPQ